MTERNANDFNLYELKQFYDFHKEWESEIKRQAKGFKIEEITGDTVLFSIDINEGKSYWKLFDRKQTSQDAIPLGWHLEV